MALYRFDLGFSTSNVSNGNFASAIWYQLAGTTPPTGMSNYQVALQSVLGVNWTQLSSAPANFNSASLGSGQGDYLLLRIFNSDGAPGNFVVRTTVIFGQGTSEASPISSSLQSPFVKNSNAIPIPVIDCDTATFSIVPPQAPPWPAAFADVGPISANSSWSYCLGQVNGPTNDYSFNVGATVYQTQGSGAGTTYAFGTDPKMHVIGTGMRRHHEPAA